MQIANHMTHPRALKRAAAAQAWLDNPDAGPTSIAQLANCSVKVAKRWKPTADGTVELGDAPRTGRKRKLDATAVASAQELASMPAVHGSRNVAKVLKVEQGLSVGASTIRRNFREYGMVYLYPKKRTAMTEKHKSDRLAWAQKKLKDNFDWSQVMFTDSKIFGLQLTVPKKGRKEWQKKGERLVEDRVRSTENLHLYVGNTEYGCTGMQSVTGPNCPKKDLYTNSETGKPNKGVTAEEYSNKVLPWFLKQGEKIFDLQEGCAGKWIFMQDGARPHTALTSKKALDMGGG